MKRSTVSTLRKKKAAGERIVALTAYDALSAAMGEAAGVDLILVGDSLGNTALGFPSTIPVTLDMMIHHAAAVSRGASVPLLVGDMPFMSYKTSAEQAMAAGARMMQEGRMHAIKVEGGAEAAPTVRRLVQAGIPVMGHIGLLPQSFHAMGGYVVQGKTEADAERLLDDARALDAAGAFGIVLEGMPAAIAARITSEIAAPTVGIGAGAECDGQILVFADLLGMSNSKSPKFVKRYANLYESCVKAISSYAEDVRGGKFPAAEHEY